MLNTFWHYARYPIAALMILWPPILHALRGKSDFDYLAWLTSLALVGIGIFVGVFVTRAKRS